MNNPNTKQRKNREYHTLLNMLNDILDENIEIRKNLSKLLGKMNHQLYKIGKEYNLINNNLMVTRDMITNRSKLIIMKNKQQELSEELASKGHINIIFD